jgi:hypothetical protein
LFDIKPPENDNEAKELSKKIKEWINKERPKPGDKMSEISENELKEPPTKEDKEQKPDKEENKSKKKRGMLGFFKK